MIELLVPAGELQPFEEVVTIDGQIWQLASTAPRADSESVYNLEVDGEHVYYVGRNGLLVHNVYIIQTLSNGKKLTHKGSSYKKVLTTLRSVPAALKKAKRLHGHHIVMKGKFSHWLTGSRKYVRYSQKVLKKAKIDIHDLRNFSHARNAGHSLDYAKWVQKNLKKAYNDPGNLTDNVTAALEKMRDAIETTGKLPWL